MSLPAALHGNNIWELVRQLTPPWFELHCGDSSQGMGGWTAPAQCAPSLLRPVRQEKRREDAAERRRGRERERRGRKQRGKGQKEEQTWTRTAAPADVRGCLPVSDLRLDPPSGAQLLRYVGQAEDKNVRERRKSSEILLLSCAALRCHGLKGDIYDLKK